MFLCGVWSYLLVMAIPIDTRQLSSEVSARTVLIDTRSSPRMVPEGSYHDIRFDTNWNDGGMVRVTLDGAVLTNSEMCASGSFAWSPDHPGEYNFEHFDGGTTLTASFIVSATAKVVSVAACQRYPWNGLVDLSFTVTGEAEAAYTVSFAAKDGTTDVGLPMPSVSYVDGSVTPVSVSPLKLKPGIYHFLWDAAADLPSGFNSEHMTITVEAR